MKLERMGLPLAVVAAAVFANAAQAETNEDVSRGKALITQNCARCHAIGMDDQSKHEKAPPFRQVVTRYPLEDLEEALAEGILSGHPDMPEFTFTADEISAILAYLDTLKSAGQPSETAPEGGAAQPATPPSAQSPVEPAKPAP